MADSKLSSSSVVDAENKSNSKQLQDENQLTMKLSQMLSKSEGNFLWNGSNAQLKRFVNEALFLSGKWTSPGGDTKQFTNESVIIKWHGPSSKKLSVIKDDNSSVVDALSDLIAKKLAVNSSNTDDHVDTTTTTSKTKPDETCNTCASRDTEIASLKAKIIEMNSVIVQLANRQNESECQTDKHLSESKKAITELSRTNNKMADEIDELKCVIEQICIDNDRMKNVLDMKQNDWIEIEKPNKSNVIKPTSLASKSYAAVTSNSFESLKDETLSNELSDDTLTQDRFESSNMTMNTETQPDTHRDQNIRTKQAEGKKDQTVSTSAQRNQDQQDTLLIGDSMTKNINNDKLSFAAKAKTVCKTYRGGKIKDIHTNLQKDCGERRLRSIILHVGTNNLVSDDAKEAAKQMEDLIVDAKSKAEKVAVSSVIKRYDNRVPHSKITEYNNLIHELCKKHNITFIDNSNIDQSMLNRSNLHLNHTGDKAFGKTLCAYLRSIRSGKTTYDSSKFFRQGRRQSSRPKDWKTCLTYLAEIAKMIQQ